MLAKSIVLCVFLIPMSPENTALLFLNALTNPVHILSLFSDLVLPYQRQQDNDCIIGRLGL